MCPTLGFSGCAYRIHIVEMRGSEEKKPAERVVIETRNGWHTGWMGPDFLAFPNG